MVQTGKMTYGILNPADITARSFTSTVHGISMTIRTRVSEFDIHSPMVGRPHVYNLLASAATGIALGFTEDDIARGISSCPVVPGRFERVESDYAKRAGFTVVVDYAHTDDALKNVLSTAREVIETGGRVVTVFGCGGDRDRTKRAPMGLAASQLSDVTIVTSDNPRSEEPLQIIRDIEEGLRQTGKPYSAIPDRTEAIQLAIREARRGDIVVIAGKGHETYQIVGSKKTDFDDRKVAREAIEQFWR
jgi:UDP-N-acetylmuramoyl-L-alanyl-D-glutamate--2,6-diaminopimelate ligase